MEEQENMSKLCKPVFINSKFNQWAKNRRFSFWKTVSYGDHTYNLWVRDSKHPDRPCTKFPNDAYFLHVEFEDYMIPLQLTEHGLEFNAGTIFAGLYQYENFEWMTEEEICDIGNNDRFQVMYINAFLKRHMEAYQKAKHAKPLGSIPGDYIGAVLYGEAGICLKIQEIRASYVEKEEERLQKETEEKNRVFFEQQNKEIQSKVDDMVDKMKSNAPITNEKIIVYADPSLGKSRETTIVSYAMQQFGVVLPPKVQGWINQRLRGVTFVDFKPVEANYAQTKSGSLPQTVPDYLREFGNKVAEMVATEITA